MPTPLLSIIGIDAAALSFINLHKQHLPSFARLLDSSFVQPLTGPGESLPGAVWPSFASGNEPGEHGIYHHLQWDPSEMRVRRISPDWLEIAPPFWVKLADQGFRVCVIDVPMTFPTPGTAALEVLNWSSHDQLGPLVTSRSEVEQQIRMRFDIAPMGTEIPVKKSARQLATIRDRLVSSAAQKAELAVSLLEQEWDLFLLVFGETHRGGHILWAPSTESSGAMVHDALLEVYRAVDRALARITERLTETHRLMLFALHGMEPDRSQTALMPQLMDQINASFQVGQEKRTKPRKLSLMRTLRARIPDRVQHAIGQTVPVQLRDWVVERATSGGLEWINTPGLALLADLSGYVRANVQGREHLGSLLPGSQGELRYLDHVAREISRIVDAQTGIPLVERILKASEAFPGPHTMMLPDLIVLWRDLPPVRRAFSSSLGIVEATTSTGRTGNHSGQGFICVPHDTRPSILRLPYRISELCPFIKDFVARATTFDET